jgi:hypothetical protein
MFDQIVANHTVTVTRDPSDTAIAHQRFALERDIVNGVRRAKFNEKGKVIGGTKNAQPKAIGFRQVHVVEERKEVRPERRTPTQTTYDAGMRGVLLPAPESKATSKSGKRAAEKKAARRAAMTPEQIKEDAIKTRARQLRGMIERALTNGWSEVRAMGFEGGRAKFRRADYDRVIRACNRILGVAS